jgi:hypothetical protein
MAKTLPSPDIPSTLTNKPGVTFNVLRTTKWFAEYGRAIYKRLISAEASIDTKDLYVGGVEVIKPTGKMGVDKLDGAGITDGYVPTVTAGVVSWASPALTTAVSLQGAYPGTPQVGNFNVTGTGGAGILTAPIFSPQYSDAVPPGTTAGAMQYISPTLFGDGRTHAGWRFAADGYVSDYGLDIVYDNIMVGGICLRDPDEGGASIVLENGANPDSFAELFNDGTGYFTGRLGSKTLLSLGDPQDEDYAVAIWHYDFAGSGPGVKFGAVTGLWNNTPVEVITGGYMVQGLGGVEEYYRVIDTFGQISVNPWKGQQLGGYYVNLWMDDELIEGALVVASSQSRIAGNNTLAPVITGSRYLGDMVHTAEEVDGWLSGSRTGPLATYKFMAPGYADQTRPNRSVFMRSPLWDTAPGAGLSLAKAQATCPISGDFAIYAGAASGDAAFVWKTPLGDIFTTDIAPYANRIPFVYVAPGAGEAGRLNLAATSAISVNNTLLLDKLGFLRNDNFKIALDSTYFLAGAMEVNALPYSFGALADAGAVVLWKNTGTNIVYLAVNDGGTIKKVAFA